ncbi:hypothetical protein PsorP6_008717 [Peronosclerospora sorghi]|uniref:Uncharacterized protein n=1 Tax=Peronosclerospora sorghi TaxID=230839 RepID=A0ACC0VZ71_9STRA|nr:hypothetical protein PsorP6_008717 [Peronosclerospora sorghi]
MNAEFKAHIESRSGWTTDWMPAGFAKNDHGQVVGFNTRLVWKGLKQKLDIDLFYTYLPMANVNTIRNVLSVVVGMGYVTEQLDIDTAFHKRRSRKRYTLKCLTA